MIGQVREWLPCDVLTHGVVRESVGQAVAAWSARWFTGPCASVAAMKYATGDPRNEKDETGWRIYRTAVAVRGTRQAFSRMVDRALDIEALPAELSEADRLLLASFGRAMIEDLVAELEHAFAIPGEMKSEPEKVADPLRDAGGLVVSLADPAGRDILTLAVPADVVVPSVKAHLGPAVRRTENLPPLSEPLRAVTMAVEARVGRVELTLAELNELAVGDVLILDRRLEQTVDVAHAGTRQVFAKAMLTSVDDGMALVFSA